MTDGYLKGRGVSLYYTDTGTGTPLLMLHGNGETHAVFDKLSGYMSAHCRVICMDSRGHGASALLETQRAAELSIADMADDAVRLLNHLKLSGAILLGFSDGANIALEAASRYPDKVLAVIAVSGNALPRGMALPCYVATVLRYGFWRLVEGITREGRNRRIAVKNRQLSGLMIHHPRLTAGDLKRIQAPVLILTGRRDLIRPRHSLWMGRQIEDSRVVFVKGADHFTLLKRERAYAGYIMRYLQERGFVIM